MARNTASKKGESPVKSVMNKIKTKIETHRVTDNERRTQASRPVGTGGGVQRGDRRDMNKTYTGNDKHSARGNSPRKDVSTRKN